MDNSHDNQDPFADRVPLWIEAPPRERGSVPPPAAPQVKAQRPVNPSQGGPKPQRGAARKSRSRRIRTVTVTCAVTGFCAVWSVVYTQMASGNDPALKNSQANAVTTTDAKSSVSGATAAAAQAAKAEAEKIAAAKKAAEEQAATDEANSQEEQQAAADAAAAAASAAAPSTSSSTAGSGSTSSSTQSSSGSAASSPAPATSSQS